MKSNSASTKRSAYGIADVVRPRAETYSGTCHQWLIIGASARRVLPTICVHSWSVSLVSRQASSGSAGHGAAASGRSSVTGTLAPLDARDLGCGWRDQRERGEVGPESPRVSGEYCHAANRSVGTNV